MGPTAEPTVEPTMGPTAEPTVEPTPGTCQHPAESLGYIEYTEHHGQDIDFGNNVYHDTPCELVGATVCNACGMIVGSNVIDYNHIERSHHVYVNGVCDQCGHVNTCSHPAEYLSTEQFFDEIYFSNYVDEGTHNETGLLFERIYCHACTATLKDEAIADNYTLSAPHNYVDGVCDECGYVNTCSHPADSVFQREVPEEIWYVNVDSLTHTKNSDYHSETYCAVCNEILSVGDMYTVSDNGSHVYINDVCYMCGRLDMPCPHTNTTVEQEYGDYTCVSVDEYNHSYTYTVYNLTYCTDCWELLDSEAFTNSTGTAYHYFRDGVCEECGHVNTCEHPKDYYHWGYWVNSTDTVSVNDSIHAVTGDLYCLYYCELCDEDLNYGELIESGYTEYASHRYDENGVCWECLHTNACDHPDYAIETEYEVYWETCEYSDAYSHINTGDEMKIDTCTLCGMIVSETVAATNVSVGEPHNYNIHGLCWTCGYMNTCEHPSDMLENREEFMFDKFYAANGASGHIVTGHYYSITHCRNCDMDISRTLIADDYAIEETHAYINGVCTLCGYVNTCAHANVTTEPGWIDPCLDSYTRTTCTYLSAGWYENTVCSDCGERIGCVLHTEDKLFTIEHEFDAGGYCIHCTYNPNEDVGQPE